MTRVSLDAFTAGGLGRIERALVDLAVTIAAGPLRVADAGLLLRGLAVCADSIGTELARRKENHPGEGEPGGIVLPHFSAADARFLFGVLARARAVCRAANGRRAGEMAEFFELLLGALPVHAGGYIN